MNNQTDLNLNVLLSNLIQTLEKDGLYKRIIVSASKKYLLGFLKLETVFPSQVFQFITKLATKDHSLERNSIVFEKNPQTTWVLNEFKLFSWIAVCYAYLIGKQLKQFNQAQYTFLNRFFPRKPQKFLEYQIKCLLRYSKVHCQNWNSEEIDLLNNIVKNQCQQSNPKWSQISYLLFCESEGKYYRSPQKCRQKWINHLDPVVQHTKWSLMEDLKLFQAVSTYGMKWSCISKTFRGTRTEHMVKNRYNSIFKSYQKKSQRTLPTKILQKIIDDLERKINNVNVKSEKQNFVQAAVNTSENGESQELILSEALTLFKSDSSISSSSEQKIMDEVTESSYSSIDELDLNEIMFSEKAIQIESPSPICCDEIKMMEIEMFSDYRRAQDSYIESLLFQ